MHELTATERLRELLDERGVKHTDPAEWLTYWGDPNGHTWSASETLSSGLFSVSTAGVGSLTPEQAITATLGAGTCRRVFYEPTGVYVCSECGRGLSKKLDKYCYLRYCPNCGRKIEVE